MRSKICHCIVFSLATSAYSTWGFIPNHDIRDNDNKSNRHHREANFHNTKSRTSNLSVPDDQPSTATPKAQQAQGSSLMMERYMEEKDDHHSFLVTQKHDEKEYLERKSEELKQIGRMISEHWNGSDWVTWWNGR